MLEGPELTEEVRRRVAALGYELVDLRRRGTRSRVVLQIRIDRPDAVPGRGITVDECATVSRALEPWLGGADVLGPRFVLEVSSPGIERPVRWREHWERFAGHDVHVRLSERGRVRATIVRVLTDPDRVVLRPAGGEEVTVALEEARDATLVVDWSRLA
jgi:ribosome maturation factor RimP